MEICSENSPSFAPELARAAAGAACRGRRTLPAAAVATDYSRGNEDEMRTSQSSVRRVLCALNFMLPTHSWLRTMPQLTMDCAVNFDAHKMMLSTHMYLLKCRQIPPPAPVGASGADCAAETAPIALTLMRQAARSRSRPVPAVRTVSC